MKVAQETGYIPLEPFLQPKNHVILDTSEEQQENQKAPTQEDEVDPLLLSIMHQQKMYSEAPEIEEKIITTEVTEKPKYVKKKKAK